MRPVKITPENMPTEYAYHDGTRYNCYYCFSDRAEVKECGGIHIINELYYTPILRCSLCGRLYYGNLTPARADEEATKARAQAEEERNALIRADEEATRAEMQRAEAKQRALERAESEAYEAKQNGDIILPHLLTV